MATENNLPQDEEVIEQQAQDQLDEDAGFNASFGIESPAEQAAGEEHQDEQEQADGPEEAAAEEANLEAGEEPENEEADAEAARERLANLLDELPTVKERAQMTEQQVRQLNGKMGEINRILKSLQDRPGSTVTKDSFKRLQAEFPEIAEILAEDLAGLSIGGQSVDVEPIVQERVKAETEKIEQKMELKLLSMVHKDWRQVTASDGFRQWVSTLPVEDQQQLASSWDSSYVADKLTQYKEFSKVKEQQAAKRNQRLVSAILPKTRTVPKRTLATEEDGFNAAFQK